MKALLTPNDLLVVMISLSVIVTAFMAHRDSGIKGVMDALKILCVVCWCSALLGVALNASCSRQPTPINITGVEK